MNFAAQVMDCPLEPGIIFLKLTIWGNLEYSLRLGVFSAPV